MYIIAAINLTPKILTELYWFGMDSTNARYDSHKVYRPTHAIFEHMEHPGIILRVFSIYLNLDRERLAF